jgi:hypothetical protein
MKHPHIIKAWHTHPETANADDLQNPDRLCFSNNDMRDIGWLCVGEAEINLRINVTPQDLAVSMCDTLRKQIQKTQFDAATKVSELERRIAELQTLTYDAKGGA